MKKILDFIKSIFKWGYIEEVIAILVSIPLFLVINYQFGKWFPQGGFFDVPSQIETIVYSSVKFVLILLLAWIGLRITLPAVYKFLRNQLYKKFEELDYETKVKWSIILLITFLAVASAATARAGVREDLTKLIYSQVGISETSDNSSPEIDKFLAHVNCPPHNPWCVAWVSYDLDKVGVDNPRTAWSPDYAKPKDIIWTPKNPKTQPLAGDVGTQYYSNLGRVGHGYFYIKTDKSGWFITGEGNANQKLSRTGGQVCILKRDPYKVHSITRYIHDNQPTNRHT